MHEDLCENCSKNATTRCSKCLTEFDIKQPSNTGMFCCKDCQKTGNSIHKAIHKALQKGSKDFRNRGINKLLQFL